MYKPKESYLNLLHTPPTRQSPNSLALCVLPYVGGMSNTPHSLWKLQSMCVNKILFSEALSSNTMVFYSFFSF